MSFNSESLANVDPNQVDLVIKGLQSSRYEIQYFAKYDILNALSTYKSLRPGLDKFWTHSAMRTLRGCQAHEVETLLNVKGSIPISHDDGDVYQIPVIFWLEKDYPASPPIGFVIPASGTRINLLSDSVNRHGRIRIADAKGNGGPSAYEVAFPFKVEFVLIDFIRLCIQEFSSTLPIVFNADQNSPTNLNSGNLGTHLTATESFFSSGKSPPGLEGLQRLYSHQSLNADSDPPNTAMEQLRLSGPSEVQVQDVDDQKIEDVSKELAELLRSQPGCRIRLVKFKNAYQSHFGRPFDVSVFGCQKLREVFESMPRVVQVVGGGEYMSVILLEWHIQQCIDILIDLPDSHPAISFSEFDSRYMERFLETIARPLSQDRIEIKEYKTWDLEKLCTAVPHIVRLKLDEGQDIKTFRWLQGTIQLTKKARSGPLADMDNLPGPTMYPLSDVGEGDDYEDYFSTLSVERKLEEFAQDCVELVMSVPDHKIPFDRFIPAYTQRFNRRCKLSNYGFEKLINLFEAVPETVKVFWLKSQGKNQRFIALTPTRYRRAVLLDGGRITPPDASGGAESSSSGSDIRIDKFAKECLEIVMSTPDHKIPWTEFFRDYHDRYGRRCKPKYYGFQSLRDLFAAVSETVCVFSQGETQYIGLIRSAGDGNPTKEDLEDASGRESAASESGNRTDQFAQECVELVKIEPDHKILWEEFRVCYHNQFKRWCSSRYYGFENLDDLFEAVSETVIVFWQGKNKYIGLSRKDRDNHLANKELNGASGRESPAPRSGSRTDKFAQECVELVMSMPDYKIPWGKFRVSYHNQFKRWLNTKYVGFETIEELFEAVSETVKVFWQGKQKYVGLTPTARDHHLASNEFDGASGPQSSASASENDTTRHFAQECVKLVMSTPENKITFGDFAASYHRYFGRQIKVFDYGYEKLLHLLEAVNDKIKVSWEGEIQYVGLTLTALYHYLHPIKELDGASGRESPASASGNNATRIFARECAELVMSIPGNKMALKEFASSYRRYFGRQLKVSDYGHEKMIQLLEAVNETAKLFWQDKERFIGLTYSARQLHLFGQDLVELLEAQPKRSIRLEHFATTYTRYFSKQFKPANHGYAKLREMLEDLPNIVQVKGINPNAFVTLQVKQKAPAPDSQNDGSLATSGHNLATPGHLFAQECDELLDKSEHIKHFGDECVELLMLSPDCR